MTTEEAIKILEPETRREAMREVPVFERIGKDQEACRIAVSAMRAKQERENPKPLSYFLEPKDSYKGLKRKYIVFKSDTGEMVENCFVLRPDKDPAAVAALRAYAGVSGNETLSADIINWVGADPNDPLTLDETDILRP